jgi:hypothetical protein
MGAISSTVMALDKGNSPHLNFQFAGGAPAPAGVGALGGAGGAQGAQGGAAGANGGASASSSGANGGASASGAQGGATGATGAGGAVGAAGAAGAAGANGGAAGADGSAAGQGGSIGDRCHHIHDLVERSERKMTQIKAWAKRNGVQGLDDDGDGHVNFVEESLENPEFKDPDLVFALKSVLAMGRKLKALLQQDTFCSYAVGKNAEGARGLLKDLKRVKASGAGADDDDDGDGDDDGDDDGDGQGDGDEDDDGDDDDEEDAKVNSTAITELLEYDSELKNQIDKFETGVHPHGYKWWRYRYEYSIVESFVLAWSVMLMYFLQWLCFGGSFFRVHRFYKTGRPERNYRYSFLYWVFHAACTCVMVFTAYMLYVPWGKDNVFNAFAKAFHDFVDDRFHVPYLGYSWLFMVLDVQFQMFTTFTLYALFTVMVVNNYIEALNDWKAVDEGHDDEVRNPINKRLFENVQEVILHRTGERPGARKEALQDLFQNECVRLEGVKELEAMHYGDEKGHHNFKVHLYLTEGLGQSIEYLVEVALVTNLWLAVCALIVAFLAHYFELAFMFFLPVFVAFGSLFLAIGFVISKHYIKLARDTSHDEVSKYVTVHSYCRSIQIVMYCIFFSFARLILSNDVFTNFPKVYIAALVGLIAFLGILAMFAGEVLKEATCALILVPHISHDKFQRMLREIKKWHTCVNCHECGVEQIPFNAAFSIAWAGRHNHPKSARTTERSQERRWSFR